MTMKQRGPSLYEVLKDTLRRQEAERLRQAAKAPPPETVGDEPADEEAEADAEPEAAAPEPEAAAPIEEEPAPEPGPVPEPEPQAAETAPVRPTGLKEIGERTLVLSYNSAAFASLILVAAVFAAYSAGLSRGRSDVDSLETPVPDTPEPITVPAPPNPPPQPATATTEWRVVAYVWKFDPNDPSRTLRRQLERAGFADLLVREETTPGGAKVIVLYCGRFADRGTSDAEFLFRRLQGQTYQGRSLAGQVRWVGFENH